MRASEFTNKPHLYLDMDGVQADFFTAWAGVFGHDRYKDIGDRAAREASINELNKKGPTWIEEFFAKLPTLSGGMRLVAWLKSHGIPFTVLSAPLRGNHEASIAGKRRWLDQHNPGTSGQAIFTGTKERYAKKGGQANILIDDHKKWVQNWIDHGGIGILYREHSVDAVIDQLAKIYGIDQDLDENFADGRKPGRKGLAKRMGVNCKQSVTKLRQIAKNSSGERARMAHWCANMKSGRKKS